MKVWNVKLIALILLAGLLLSACGGQSAATLPASQPTEVAASSTQASANAPASTESQQSAPTPVVAAGVSFTKDIEPILSSRCINCHGGDRTEKGLNLTSYTNLMQGSQNGAVITAGSADQSVLAQLVLNGKMPKRGPKLTPSQIQAIVDWIDQGASNN